MSSIRTLATATVLASASISSSVWALGQEDPYKALHQYDFQNRKPVHAIFSQIQEAGTDKAKQSVIEAGLIGVLQDPSATIAGKQEAARFLWEMGSAKSVPVLAKLLPDPATNNLARYALERNADPSAAAALRAGLKITKGPALVGVINSIGNRGDAQAVSSLKALAVSTDPLVSDAAIAALGKIGNRDAVAALKSIPNKTTAVYNNMLRSAEKMAAAGNKADSIKLYESLTDAAFPEVIRAGGLTGLASLNAPSTGAKALTLAETAKEPVLQRAAARVAGSLPSETSNAIAAWSKLPVPAQIALLSAWSDRKELSAASTAAQALKSDNGDVRAAAIRANARLGGAAIVPALAGFAGGGDQAQVARETLARMGGTGVEAALIGLAQQGKNETRAAVIDILGERPTATSTAALLKLAEGSDTYIASAALKTLRKTAGIEQEAPLVGVLTSTKDDNVRDAAQTAIVAIAQRTGDRNRVAEPLLSAMNQASAPGKAAIISALAEVGGDKALEVITNATSSSEEEIKSAAVNGLANTWSDASGLPALLKLSKNGASKADRVVALRGYLRIVGADDRAPAEERLSRVQQAMSLAERPEEKRQALSVVREIRTPGAIELAAKALDDSELVAEAADAVIYLAAPQRKNNRNLPAVKGDTTNAALDKVISNAKDDNTKEQARKLRG